MYCAIIGDIVDSKKLKNRSDAQNKLTCVLNEINETFYKDIQSKFLITLGDEFQGLLCAEGDFLSIIKKIKIEMYPIKFRFGIGIGDISTQTKNTFAIGADGSAYHCAREAVNQLKSEEKKKESVYRTIWLSYTEIPSRIKCGHVDKVDINILNTSLSACSYIEKNWTQKQVDVIKLKEKGYTQTEIAKKMDIKQSSVHRRLDASGYYTYENCLKQIKQYIDRKGW